MAKTESRIQASIIASLSINGARGIKQSASNVVGIPDLLVLLGNGRHFWIECKTIKGQVSPRQVNFHRKLSDINDSVFICRSKEDALRALEDVRNAID